MALALFVATACQLGLAGNSQPLAAFNDFDRILEIGMQAVLKEYVSTIAADWEFDVVTHTIGSKEHFRWQRRPDFPAETICVSFRRFIMKHPVDKHGRHPIDWQFCSITLTPDGKVHEMLSHTRTLFEPKKKETVEQ
jgi:hypothetical protein